MQRRSLKMKKMISQKGYARSAGRNFRGRETELDRRKAMLGYTEKNTRLAHHKCHRESQEEKGFA